jgi:hypothetical protein
MNRAEEIFSQTLKTIIINSWGKDKGNHCRVGGFICDKKIILIYINFSFDFLGLDNVYI